MRRFAWQIGGLSLGVALVIGLGVLAFGCGGGGTARPTAVVSPTARATATADPRVAEVEAAVRRYVQALADAMRTGSPTQLDALSVPGSQAEGNAGVIAGIVHDTHTAFISATVTVSSLDVQVNSTTATATVDYSFTGHDADWPSLTPKPGNSRTVVGHSVLDLSLVSGAWLIERAS